MDDMIHRYANLKQTPVSVKNMIVFGKDANMNTLLRSHAFLRCELPIRLAHIAKEITALPEELLEVSGSILFALAGLGVVHALQMRGRSDQAPR